VDAVARLGLARGDEQLAIDGRRFLEADLAAFAAAEPDPTTWAVRRAGKELALTAELSAADRRALADSVALTAPPSLQVVPTADGAAAKAGLRAGDVLVSLDGVTLRDWEHLRATVREQGETPLHATVLRPAPDHRPGEELGGAEVDLTIHPQRTPIADFGFTRSIPPLMNEVRAASFFEAIRVGTVCSIDLVKQLYVTMKRLITGEVGAKNLGGIIRISQVSYQAAQRGMSWFWYFLALLSVNLAFVNLLPIPVLDGGHLLFLLIERVKGSPVSGKVFGYSQVVGLVFVLLLVIFVTYNDILRLL
ncbi:MAG: RIP metalloprotease RseP, partial [Planctomycetota bacterium]|nr:RIP metalloprotease RseP [Planctomycetota bacterium]